MLTLISYAPALGLRCPSPFGMKGEALMKMSGLPFEVEHGDPRKAPHGKLPVLRDGEKLIPDTALIQHYLETEKHVDFDGHLTTAQRATDTAFRRLIEHHLYFLNARERWQDNPDAVRDAFFTEVPSILRGFVFGMIQKRVLKTQHMQGIGRHTKAQLEIFQREDIDALATHLGDNEWFHGEHLSSIDASLFGALHGMLDCTLDTAGKRVVMQHPNLMAYTKRFAEVVLDG